MFRNFDTARRSPPQKARLKRPVGAKVTSLRAGRVSLNTFCCSVPQVPTITKQSTVLVAFPFDEHFQVECEAKGNPEPQ